MNTAFSESGVDAAVRIVHYHEVSGYYEPSPMDPFWDVAGLASAIRAGSSPFAGVAQLRTDHDADLVHMLFDGSESPYACGWAFYIDDPAGDDDQFVSVAGDECISSQNVFAHEIGHNLGGGHDVGIETEPVPYSYSHGFTRKAPVRRSILGSGDCVMGSCSRLNRWSGPNVYAGGDPMGDASTADMVSSLDDTVPVVADYRTPNASTPGLPQSVDVEPALCYDLNWLSWSAATGIAGWYEVQTSLQSNFSTTIDTYRGPIQTLIAVSAFQTTYVRVRTCNSASCSAWVSSGTPATFTNSCV
jgi:hypothetical protein